VSALDSARLVEQAQAGDREAFDRLVDETYTMVHATAYRLTGDPDLAGDATQDAYVRAYTSLNRFRGSSSFSTWLYRIVVNVSLDALRRRSRSPEPLSALSDDETEREFDVVDESPDPGATVESRERRRLVFRALQQLGGDHRAVLVLFDLNGFSYDEIAEILGIPLGTVKSRLNRARLALRDAMQPHAELFGA
jgi:RNA polymerase sigma-70 factor (ECF subfamily)